MKPSDELTRENEALRDRLSRLSEAGRRINESLELEEVLQEVLDSAPTGWSTTVSVLKVKPGRPDKVGSCSRGVSPRECLDALQR